MRRSNALLAALALTAVPSLASATVMIPLTIEDMAVQSAVVVRGKVLGSHAVWDQTHQRIYTFTEIEVLDAMHTPSPLPKTVTVRTLGGEVGKIGMRVSGTERFTPNEEVVIFLRADPSDAKVFQTVGMSQGKFNVLHEEKATVVVPSHEGLAFAKPDEKTGTMTIGDAPEPSRITLVELRDRVKAAIAAKAAAPANNTPVQLPAQGTPGPQPAVDQR
jgi:hypothetical protein